MVCRRPHAAHAAPHFTHPSHNAGNAASFAPASGVMETAGEWRADYVRTDALIGSRVPSIDAAHAAEHAGGARQKVRYPRRALDLLLYIPLRSCYLAKDLAGRRCCCVQSTSLARQHCVYRSSRARRHERATRGGGAGGGGARAERDLDHRCVNDFRRRSGSAANARRHAQWPAPLSTRPGRTRTRLPSASKCCGSASSTRPSTLARAGLAQP